MKVSSTTPARPSLQVRQARGHDEVSVADDADEVGDRLHLGENMGREEDGATTIADIPDELDELVLHEWIES